jgi:hypothetical protein
MLIRAILPDYALSDGLPKVQEGDFDDAKINALNVQGYNIYWLPNGPSHYDPSVTVDGSHIDRFSFVFVDMDLKEGVYPNKDAFLSALGAFPLLPTRVIDSGNGIHAFWQASDLDAMSFLRLNRRLCRRLQTDEAVSKIYQLMRLPGTANTKRAEDLKLCEELGDTGLVYTCEQLNAVLPPITQADEAYCQQHYARTYKLEQAAVIDDTLPPKFASLLRENAEVKAIWVGGSDDRSKADYRLGHIMFASGFTKEEAASVLVNSAKALSRAPVHRAAYATNIIDKIWTFEIEGPAGLDLSESVASILRKGGDTLKGTRFPCHTYIDATEHGFRLGQVIGLVAGSGVGKTAMALQMFKWFVERNPDYIHMFIPLEQPAAEIADRWRTMCGDDSSLHEKVHVMSNYAPDGGYRNLSFGEIKDYILKFQATTKQKIGCVVIDHIGALKKSSREGRQSIEDICHEMKGFAVQTNTLLVMQSQAPREKAGIGDLELDKSAAYGTVFFESYCDYLITIFQPLKRVYSEEGCPTVTAFKFCKIRHKKQHLDKIKEDVCYRLFFDPAKEQFRELTQEEEISFDFFNKKAVNRRKEDRKTDIIPYQSVSWTKEPTNETDNVSESKNLH